MVGAGGHALVCIEVLREAGIEVAGCVSSDGTTSADLGALGVPMLGTDRDLATLVAGGYTQWFVAVGDNAARSRASMAVLAAGGELVTAVSPRAAVSPSALVGPGALVMPGAVVNALATVASGAIVNTGATVDHECSIGEFVHVAPRAAIAGRVTVGEQALIGIGSAVIPGVRIGAHAVVGAGAAVLVDVEPSATVVGVPARTVAVRGLAVSSGDAVGNELARSDPDRPPRILIVCTGNLCRSPLAEALLRRGLEEMGTEAEVTSAGVAAPAAQLPDNKTIRVADEFEVGSIVRFHRSKQVTAEMLAEADLVLAMTAEQLEQVERVLPGFDRAVMLRTAAWRARVMGGRPLDFHEWARRLAATPPDGGPAGRDASDDIADPMGGRMRQYRAMADEVDHLLGTLIAHWSGR